MVRHFLTYMAWNVATSPLTSFSFYEDTGKRRYWLSWDLKNPANLLKNNLNNTKNYMKFQIQNNNNNNNNDLLLFIKETDVCSFADDTTLYKRESDLDIVLENLEMDANIAIN